MQEAQLTSASVRVSRLQKKESGAHPIISVVYIVFFSSLLCIIIVFQLDLLHCSLFKRRLLKQDKARFTASRDQSGSLT